MVPPSAISLLIEYSNGGPPNERLSSFIPALGMIFLNTPKGGNEPVDAPELRGLSGTLAHRATLIFNDLVNNRIIVRRPSQPPESSPREWEDTGSFYGRPPIRCRPYYEERDNSDKDVDSAESGDCKKSILCNVQITEGIMALWCPHLIRLWFHKIPRAEGRKDVFSALYVYLEKASATSFTTLHVSLAHTQCLENLSSSKTRALPSTKCTLKAILPVHQLPSQAIICKAEQCCKV